LKSIKRKVVLVLLTFAFSYLIAKVLFAVSDKVNLLDKFSIALLDVDFTDLYYQYNRHEALDTNIFLVNVGNLDRLALSNLTNRIGNDTPKVIGFDVIFGSDVDTLQVAGTDSLIASFRNLRCAVLGEALYGQTDDGRDTVDQASPQVRQWVREGLVNLNIPLGDRRYGTVREFLSKEKVNGADQVSFSFQVAGFLDSSRLRHARNGNIPIKWYGTGRPGNGHVFNSFDWSDVMEGNIQPGLFKDKIVLLGWMGSSVAGEEPDYNSMFYTPLNEKLVGRSLPDMYGVEIHANSVKMIVDDEFVYTSNWLDMSYDLLVMISFLLFLDWLRNRYPQAYPLLSKVALIAAINVLILGVVLVYFLTKTQTKIFISDAIVLLLLFPDTLDFLLSNKWLARRKWLGLQADTFSVEEEIVSAEIGSPRASQ
jgi:CHASE2 domain-containing sensor protein